ncbi:MAG TPA: hypothetical protein VHU90_11545, partial [Galbitalea sp.]|nr:hypothetical protein [Galbitalea sp.]
ASPAQSWSSTPHRREPTGPPPNGKPATAATSLQASMLELKNTTTQAPIEEVTPIPELTAA